ncbi:MAG TPA: flagellar hook capping FlgD N-terminal domain-containing protein [Rhizomicrobium sp.]|jgi:flagellar basal-body rod modification protein FlgD|nr:flagellar hook capping FlgD N-terminal domain-containing protein [Rhizomicrobium sp.]
MTVTPTSNTTTPPASTSSSGGAMQQLSSNFSTFLTLLTTQLQNQDPTSPMDSSQFTQQLVEYSQVEQQIDTNSNLQTLITQGQSQGSAVATTYLGKQVTVTNGEAPLSGGTATWNYTLGTDASATALTVTNSAGQAVYSGTGETGSGAHAFTWDGKDQNGNQLSDGVYTLNVTAKALDSSAVTSTVSSTGVVGEIDMSSGTPQLVIGPMSVGLSQVANVEN